MKNILSLIILSLAALAFSADEFENVWLLEGKGDLTPAAKSGRYLDDVYNYDVQSYQLGLDVCDTTTKITRAEVIVRVKTTTGNFNQAIFDFYRKTAGSGFNITIDSIFYSDATHSSYPVNQSTEIDWNDNKRLKITLPSALNNGDEFSCRFVYHGSDLTVYDAGLGWSLGVEYKIVSNRAVIQSVSCPEGSGSWFPCKDLPSDKATFKMLIKSWPHQKAVSNGKLISETATVDNKKLTVWLTAYPQSTYLTFFAVSSYRLYEQSYTSLDSSKTMPIMNYLYPSTYNSSLNGLSQYPEMIKALATRLGEYPFINEKAGNVSYILGGGMEHQTIPAIQSTSFSEMLLLHELSHQWIGDQSTCQTWNDTWINEGGASYCEALWKEYKLGFTGYKSWMNGFRGTAISSSANKPLYGFTPTFGTVIYHKGAWIYHMLRYILGDDAYFAAQKKLLSQSVHSYGNVSTEDFFNFFAAETGKNLNWFKDQWVLKGGYPKYSVGYQAENTASGSTVRFQLKQTQTTTAVIPYFKMPVPVLVKYEDNTDTLLVLNDSLQYQEFAFNLPKTAKSAMTIDQFNYNDKVLCTKTLVAFVGINSEELVIRNAELFQNYPNPFNNTTLISFALPNTGKTELAVFNAKGELVKELVNREMSAGKHSFEFKADNLNSGVYFYRLKFGGRTLENKLVLVK